MVIYITSNVLKIWSPTLRTAFLMIQSFWKAVVYISRDQMKDYIVWLDNVTSYKIWERLYEDIYHNITLVGKKKQIMSSNKKDN